MFSIQLLGSSTAKFISPLDGKRSLHFEIKADNGKLDFEINSQIINHGIIPLSQYEKSLK